MKKTAIIGSPTLHLNYKSALEKAFCEAVIFPDASYIKRHPDAFDGLLLPGGGDVPASISGYSSSSPLGHKVSTPATDSDSVQDFRLDLEQLSALHLFCEQKKPVLGICKGMQLINLYFGGSIRNVKNQNLHQHPEKDAFHPADNQPGSFLHALFGPHMMINSSHHQCIDTPAQNLQIIQHAADGEAEALVHLSYPVFGTQWHPERMPKLSRQDAILLFQYFVSLL